MRYNSRMATKQLTAKEALVNAIMAMTDDEAEDLLDYLELQADPGDLTEEEHKRILTIDAEVERGEYVTLEELKAEYDR